MNLIEEEKQGAANGGIKPQQIGNPPGAAAGGNPSTSNYTSNYKFNKAPNVTNKVSPHRGGAVVMSKVSASDVSGVNH